MSIQPRRYVDTSHGRLAYLRGGSGPPVILIHGALVCADDMALALMARLSQRYDVIAFDRPGHGGSDQTSQEAGSPYAQADMLSAGWQALGIERPCVVGHSFGGAVALSLALAQPDDIAGAVALAPICFPEVRLEHLLFGPRGLPFIGSTLARSQGAVVDLLALALLRNAMFLPQIMPSDYAAAFPFAWMSRPPMMIANAKDSLALLFALTRSAAAYADCRAKVHIIGGTRDTVVANARHGLAASRLMPSADFEWADGCGHMLHHFRQARVEEILAGL